jgi:hypothetical protein
MTVGGAVEDCDWIWPLFMDMAGIPALMGIDISGSLKMGIPGMGTGTPQDTIYGVYGGLTRKGINA